MKIIWTDGFNRESVADKLVAENVREHEGKIMIKALESACKGGDESDWYMLVPDDYRLSRGMEDLV